MPPPPPLSRSAIGSRQNRTRTTSSTFDPLAAQTGGARIRRPPRNRSFTTPTRLLWEQQLQHVVSETNAAPTTTTPVSSSPEFPWDPTLTLSQAQSLEGQAVQQQSWSLSGTPQSSGVDISTFPVETAPQVYEGGDTAARNLGFDEQLNTEDMR